MFEWAEIQALCPALLDLLGKIDSPIHSAPIRANMPHYLLLRAVICSVQCVGSVSSKKVEWRPVEMYGFDIRLFRQRLNGPVESDTFILCRIQFYRIQRDL